MLDFTNRGPLILISGFQTPTAIRQLGAARPTGWLKFPHPQQGEKSRTRFCAVTTVPPGMVEPGWRLVSIIEAGKNRRGCESTQRHAGCHSKHVAGASRRNARAPRYEPCVGPLARTPRLKRYA